MNVIAFKQALTNPASRHWLLQRLSAILLLPLTIQAIVFIRLCLNAPFTQTLAWLASAFNLICLELWLLTVFYHAATGMQVVIEDYVANQALQLLLIKLINFACISLTVAALYFIFRIV